MGKYVWFATVAFIVIVIGMLVYPPVHTVISAIDVTDFTDLEKTGMVFLAYGLLFFMGYIVWKHI